MDRQPNEHGRGLMPNIDKLEPDLLKASADQKLSGLSPSLFITIVVLFGILTFIDYYFLG